MPLVGRAELRDRLWAAIGQVAAAGPRAVVLEGLAGTGKTRLATWLSEAAHEVGAARALRLTQANVPGQGVADLDQLASALGVRGLGVLDVANRLRTRLAEEADRMTLARALAAPPAKAPERIAALALGVRALAARRPLVLHVDDAQWGAEALSLVTQLMSGDVSVLAVLTVRTDLLGPDATKQITTLAEHDGVERIEVPALPHSAGLALARGILGLSPDLAGRVAERAAGNPLMAVQLVEGWAASGALRSGPAGWDLAGDARIPEDLLSVWQARLAPLAAHRDLLELAALLGLEVDLDEWQRACAIAGLPVPDAAAEALQDAGLARFQRLRMVLVHGMLREALLRQAEEGGRLARWHAACARTVGPEPAERLARHLLGAGRDAEAIDPLFQASSARRLATEYGVALELLKAQGQAMDRAGVPEGDDRRGEAMAVEIGVRWFLGQAKEADALSARTLDLSRRYGWVMPRLRLLINQGESLINAGELFAADPVSAEVVEVSRAADVEPRWKVIPLISRASVVLRLGRCDEAHALLDEAEAIEEGLDARLKLVAMHTRACALINATRFEDARRVLEQTIPLADVQTYPWMAALLTELFAWMLVDLGELDAAEHWLDRCDQAYRQVGMVVGVSRQLGRARLELARGNPETAHALLLAARTDPFLAQSPGVAADCALVLTEVLVALGRIDEARTTLAEAAPVFERQGQVAPWAIAAARRIAAEPALYQPATALADVLASRLPG